MKTDSIFYQLFQTFPRCFFDLLALPPDTANRYRFSSVEIKQLAFRLDGVFLPDTLTQVIYFVEVQFQRDSKFYSRFFSEIFFYLHQTEVSNDWQGVMIYPQRQIENTKTLRYQEFFDSGRVRRFYLDELTEMESVGMARLKLIIAPEDSAIEQGRGLIQKIRQEIIGTRQQRELLELIETILFYKLPKISRKEIEAMFRLSDLKQTKVYQEALEEGIEQGIEQGRVQGKLESVPHLAALGLSLEQIAQALQLDIQQVREVIQSTQ